MSLNGYDIIRKLWFVLLFPALVYCAELLPDISTQISGMLYGDLPLESALFYPDTPENRKLVLTEIAKLYGHPTLNRSSGCFHVY